eukprot:s272_g14.t1
MAKVLAWKIFLVPSLDDFRVAFLSPWIRPRSWRCRIVGIQPVTPPSGSWCTMRQKVLARCQASSTKFAGAPEAKALSAAAWVNELELLAESGWRLPRRAKEAEQGNFCKPLNL